MRRRRHRVLVVAACRRRGSDRCRRLSRDCSWPYSKGREQSRSTTAPADWSYVIPPAPEPDSGRARAGTDPAGANRCARRRGNPDRQPRQLAATSSARSTWERTGHSRSDSPRRGPSRAHAPSTRAARSSSRCANEAHGGLGVAGEDVVGRAAATACRLKPVASSRPKAGHRGRTSGFNRPPRFHAAELCASSTTRTPSVKAPNRCSQLTLRPAELGPGLAHVVGDRVEGAQAPVVVDGEERRLQEPVDEALRRRALADEALERAARARRSSSLWRARATRPAPGGSSRRRRARARRRGRARGRRCRRRRSRSTIVSVCARWYGSRRSVVPRLLRRLARLEQVAHDERARRSRRRRPCARRRRARRRDRRR